MGLTAPTAACSLYRIAMAFIPFVLAANVTAAQSDHIKPPFVAPKASDLRLRIETERTAYRVGDAIRVRLTLINSSARTILVPPGSALSMADLLVYDAAGHKIDPTVGVRRGRFSGPGTPLKPQDQMILRGQQGEWVSLGEFGYEFGVPGNFTLVGFASIAPPPGYPIVDSKSSAVKYNEVAFTITR